MLNLLKDRCVYPAPIEPGRPRIINPTPTRHKETLSEPGWLGLGDSQIELVDLESDFEFNTFSPPP